MSLGPRPFDCKKKKASDVELEVFDCVCVLSQASHYPTWVVRKWNGTPSNIIETCETSSVIAQSILKRDARQRNRDTIAILSPSVGL